MTPEDERGANEDDQYYDEEGLSAQKKQNCEKKRKISNSLKAY